MHAEAMTPLVRSLPPLRMMLLFGGVLVVDVSAWAAGALWVAAAATVGASVLLAREIDRRRPPLAAAQRPAPPDDEEAPQSDESLGADAPEASALRWPAAAAPDGSAAPASRRSVVCGVDGSVESQAAADVAARLAERLDAKLVLAHVIEAGSGDVAPTTAAALLSQSAETAGADWADCRVAVGFTADRLADLAEEERAELLVVGSRGRGSLRAAFLGSVSSSLIGVARCPVLVVPPGAAGR